MHVHSFPPIVNASSHTLVLGSMPGKASLRANQYYAHPRNLFWPFMHRLLGIDATIRYDQRVAALLRHRVALWDVLQSCTRHSSLDSDIVTTSMVCNDFERLFARYPGIRVVCFNGAKAAETFTKRIVAQLGPRSDDLAFHRLPSTSPANAAIPFDRKLDAWRVVVRSAVDC